MIKVANPEWYQDLLDRITSLEEQLSVTKSKPPSKRARPESIDQAIQYGATLGMEKVDVESWWDHFESNGWKVAGRTPMKCWKSALRNAKRNPIHASRTNSVTASKRPPTIYSLQSQRDTVQVEINRLKGIRDLSLTGLTGTNKSDFLNLVSKKKQLTRQIANFDQK
jgi:hypothetical protein